MEPGVDSGVMEILRLPIGELKGLNIKYYHKCTNLSCGIQILLATWLIITF